MADEPTNPDIPKWIEERVLPATEERVKSLHLLKEGGMRKSALLFTNDHAYVAEKATLRGVKLYEVEYPQGLLLNQTACPHCGETIQEPVRKVATTDGGGNGRKKSKTQAKPTTRSIYAGEDIPVNEIEGVGTTYLDRLADVGIETTNDLLASDIGTVTKVSKAPKATVQKWYGMAELMRVKGIGKQFAELLVRSGITSIDELKAQKPKQLAELVNAKMESLDVTIQGAGVSEKRAGNWIKAARQMKKTKVDAPGIPA